MLLLVVVSVVRLVEWIDVIHVLVLETGGYVIILYEVMVKQVM